MIHHVSDWQIRNPSTSGLRLLYYNPRLGYAKEIARSSNWGFIHWAIVIAGNAVRTGLF